MGCVYQEDRSARALNKVVILRGRRSRRTMGEEAEESGDAEIK